MKIKELKTLTGRELNDKLSEIRLELIKDRAQMSTGSNKKGSGSLKQKKKVIAKILTLINEKGKIEQKSKEKTQ